MTPRRSVRTAPAKRQANRRAPVGAAAPSAFKPGLVPGGAHDERCLTVREVLGRVGDKWSVLVVSLLGDGPRRFNELRRTIDGVSQRMLTLTLRGLERDGLVDRTVTPTVPPRVDYALTRLGRTLLQPVAALARWAGDNGAAIRSARATFDARETTKPLPPARAVVRRG